MTSLLKSLKRKDTNGNSKNAKRQKKEDSSASESSGSEDDYSSDENIKVKSNIKDKNREKELQQRRANHNKTVEEAQKQNKKNGIRGKIRVSKLPHYRAKKSEGSKLWPLIDGHKNINVCSGSQGIFKELSPMFVGPVEYSGDAGTGGKPVTVKNIENLWQFSKVWEGETDEEGKPNKEFFDRRKQGWNQQKGQRWVKKGTGTNKNVSLFSYWKDKHLSYKEARREIYCPEYAKHVVKTKAYKELEKLLDEGYNINILGKDGKFRSFNEKGYDGYDYENEGKTLEDCFNDISRPFGHEHVLAAMVSNNQVWELKKEVQKELNDANNNKSQSPLKNSNQSKQTSPVKKPEAKKEMNGDGVGDL